MRHVEYVWKWGVDHSAGYLDTDLASVAVIDGGKIQFMLERPIVSQTDFSRACEIDELQRGCHAPTNVRLLYQTAQSSLLRLVCTFQRDV
jgi:hypothetical protein